MEAAFLVALHQCVKAHKVSPCGLSSLAIFQVPQFRARLHPDTYRVKAAKKGLKEVDTQHIEQHYDQNDYQQDGDYRASFSPHALTSLSPVTTEALPEAAVRR